MEGTIRTRRLLVLLGAVGCGLISPDVTKLSFDLPPKSYSFDTNSSMWRLPPGILPLVPCGPDQVIMDCCNPPTPLPKPNCALTPLVCEQDLCTLKFQVTIVQPIDLKNEVPQLKSLDSQHLVKVFISQIRYSVTDTLNVDLPPVELYIAPDGVTSPLDPQAEKFGTVPSLRAMMSGDGAVDLEPGSDLIFAKYAYELGTPFNFIASTTIVVPSGSPIPNGKVDITITGQISASL